MTTTPDPQTIDREILDHVRQAAEAALSRNAVDLQILKLVGLTTVADYFLICGGKNRTQTQAIADAVESTLRDQRLKSRHVEGYGRAQWILMDYGDFVVHVFDQERRAFVGLDRLWGDAPEISDELELEKAS